MMVKSFDGYRASLRSAVRAFWSGEWGWYEFHEELSTAIRTYFPQAWREGLALAGLTPDDMTDAERVRLEQEIVREIGYIPPFADAVERGSKANGGKLGPLMSRADRWAATYNRIRDLAMTFAQNDPKLRWQIGPVKTEHCADCLRLNGKVKRSSTWRAADLAPRMWKLACHGVHCKCEFQVTTERLSPGPLPVI